jgi:hypothetical protein
MLVAGIAASWLWLSAPGEAHAKPPVKKARRVVKAKGRVKASVKVVTTTSAGDSAAAAAKAAAQKAAQARASGEVVTTEGGAKAKLYNFNALDIDGKLKAPQLLYFLNRIKGEFDESTLDRRSFMPELDRTRDDPNL